jgi:hypothetical protein
MRLPFAVYTATEGYCWTAGRSHDRAMLERLRRAVGKTPDFDYGASPCCGAVNDGDTVAVYRFMRAEKWDSKGRNAAYLALSFFPRALAGAVDVGRLLALEPFRAPLRCPPDWLDYEGPGAEASGFDPEAEGCSGTTPNLSSAGSVFQTPFAGVLRMRLDDGASSCRVAYRRPEPQLTECAPPLKAQAATSEVEAATANRRPEPKVQGPRLFKRAAWVAAASALFVCGFYWRATNCGKRAARITISKPVIETARHGERCNSRFSWLFAADGHWRGLSGCPGPQVGKDGEL